MIPGAHDLIATYWAAAEARDWDAFAALMADDVVYEAPQTRERVRGRDAYLRFNRETERGKDHPWRSCQYRVGGRFGLEAGAA